MTLALRCGFPPVASAGILVLWILLPASSLAWVGPAGGSARRTTPGVPVSCSFQRSFRSCVSPPAGRSKTTAAAAAASRSTAPPAEEEVSKLESYEYDGWNLTYRTLASGDGSDSENETSGSGDHHNVLFVHPVGIGLSSWFWDPLLARIKDRNERQTTKGGGTTLRAYAPNLIGCGISEGSDAWDPDQRGLPLPLGWARGCEALMREIDDRDRGKTTGPPPSWTVVAQGGLAPVGLLLAARNPATVQKLVLASPPTWGDMVTPVPASELERNYGLLRSRILGRLAFSILEKRPFIEFFSRLFLFTKDGESGRSEDCDIETWLDNTERELCGEARPPVWAFNAGLCQHRSFSDEFETIRETGTQELVVVQGANDLRDRSGYVSNRAVGDLVVVPGATNVVPWERPSALVDLLG
ncbi:unnamed protein product [Pseudo-nitzschia multistriata]|uniref:Uncharacterized protein n=1 Tax=Pseudo-nitzschia multistriata TaxID=183589 RepID=A0A448YYY6_9STRA|nr:unnamed protein product [Pseudo-nitzschia multistriata]